MSTSRIINQRALIDAVYANNGISKAALATKLNLSKPAVSRNVADLISKGLVEERGKGEASKSGGRKPTMLYFNNSHRYIATVVLSFDQPVCAIGDLSYNILSLKKAEATRDSESEVKRESIAATINEMLKELSIPKEKLALIVISHPGIISWDNEASYSQIVHFPWTGIGLRYYLVESFNTPVYLENDMRLAALGEKCMGFNNQYSDLIYVLCGIGFGASVIHNGKPVLGCNRAAGEMGAFLTEDGKLLEDVVATSGLLSLVKELYTKHGLSTKDINFEKVVKLSLSNEPIVNHAVYETGRVLGKAIYNSCVMFDIPTVILGGDYCKLGPALFDGINEIVSKPSLLIRPNVIKSELREAAGMYGSFVIGTEEVLSRTL